jgi:hypothetical protein
MPLSLRLLLLSAICLSLTSCGTASHFLNMASGLVSSVTSPVLGAIRLSDTPAEPDAKPYAIKTSKPAHDSRPAPAKRPR